MVFGTGFFGFLVSRLPRFFSLAMALLLEALSVGDLHRTVDEGSSSDLIQAAIGASDDPNCAMKRLADQSSIRCSTMNSEACCLASLSLRAVIVREVSTLPSAANLWIW